MRADRSVDLDRVPALVDRLVHDGLDGLYVLGSTGEGPSLTTSERRAVAEAFVAAGRGRLPVVVQVGHQSVAEARGLAAHAEAIGADAVSAVFTSYYPVRDLDDVVASLADVAGGAPATPFYYYSIPALSGLSCDVVDLLGRLEARVPTLAGVKYTAPTVFEFQECVRQFGDRMDVLYGCDEMLLAGWTAGAHGAVGSTYDFAAPLYRRLLSAVDRGDVDVARAEQERSVRMVRTVLRHGGAPAIKATMALCGFDCGPVRPPQRTLDARAVEALRTDLEEIGFFGWIAPGPAG